MSTTPNTSANVTLTRKIAAPAWETTSYADHTRVVELHEATFAVRTRCVCCMQDATLVARRPGDTAGVFDVPWCSRECRIRDCRIVQPVASVRQTRGRRVPA